MTTKTKKDVGTNAIGLGGSKVLSPEISNSRLNSANPEPSSCSDTVLFLVFFPPGPDLQVAGGKSDSPLSSVSE